MTAINLIVSSTECGLRRTTELTGWLKARARTAHWRRIGALLIPIDFLARAFYHVWRQRQYLTCYKLLNMALVNIEFKLKTEYVLGRPYRMKIEPTNICNTKCQLCPTGIGLEGRDKGKMTLDQFMTLVDRLKRHLMSLDLSMWGDPLIVPEIYQMIRFAHDKRIWTYVSSNLHAYKLGKGHAERLVASGLDMLTCSLHGASQRTYEIYQPGKRLDECIVKIREIIETRQRIGSPTPAVQLNFVVTRHNEHERETFGELAADLGCTPTFSIASANVRFVGQNHQLVDLKLAPDVKRKAQLQLLKHWLPKDPDFVLEPYRQIMSGQYRPEDWNGKKLYDCDWPWRSTVVNWNGNVVTCCGSFDPSEDMGNVFAGSFGKIWNGKKYRLARRSYRKRLTDEQAASNPCATCPGFLI